MQRTWVWIEFSQSFLSWASYLLFLSPGFSFSSIYWTWWDIFPSAPWGWNEATLVSTLSLLRKSYSTNVASVLSNLYLVRFGDLFTIPYVCSETQTHLAQGSWFASWIYLSSIFLLMFAYLGAQQSFSFMFLVIFYSVAAQNPDSIIWSLRLLKSLAPSVQVVCHSTLHFKQRRVCGKYLIIHMEELSEFK